MNNLSLYIHIPFCVSKCNYCDFLSASCDEETKQKYVEVLCREITQRAEKFKDKKIDTIFLGGGTPSILSVEQITKLMTAIRQNFQILPDAEISMEMNPGTVNKAKLESYKEQGINRLSIGLQSANNEELKILGRIHTWEEFLQTWNLVREAGFANVNIDLMSALPGQTMESYRETLEKVLVLRPEHISAYSLIVEEGTPFFEWFGEESKRRNELPDETTDRQMYELTKEMLEERGYYRYEISNYALKGYECKHNIGYWKRKEYLGLGLGAASLFLNDDVSHQMQNLTDKSSETNIRCSNISDLQTYLEVGSEQISMNDESCKKKQTEVNVKEQKWIEEQTDLSLTDQMEEFMFLGLRMMEGVSPMEFELQFGKSLQEVYGIQISKLEKQGLLEFHQKTGRYALTLQGIDVSNQVFVEFIE